MNLLKKHYEKFILAALLLIFILLLGFQIAVIQSQSAAPYVPREMSDSAR